MTPESGLDLRQLRTFVTVAERRSFTRAAEELGVAQQAVSQQIKALERSLRVTLLRRTPHRVALTPEGAVLLADGRRVLAASERAARNVQAAARGEAGVLRMAYTLTTVWDTIPTLLAGLGEALPDVKVEAREVFGADIPEFLVTERCDLAVAPATSHLAGFQSRTLRLESWRLAVSRADPLARRQRVDLAALADRVFQLWPREMAPGFYDAVVAICRSAGFEPRRDENAAGNTVWGSLARGQCVALINASFAEQLPRGVALVKLAGAPSPLAYEAVWCHDDVPLVRRALGVAAQIGAQRGWLPPRA